MTKAIENFRHSFIQDIFRDDITSFIIISEAWIYSVVRNKNWR